MAAVLIRQFDVFRNPAATRSLFPFVVVLQSDAIHQTRSVVVAPMIPESSVSESRLTPTFEIEGRNWTLIVSDIAALPRSRLTQHVASLDGERYRIKAALDLLFVGF